MPIPPIEVVDISVIILYLLATVWLGYRLSGRQTTVNQYFLTDRTVPWWAVMFSIVATETSTVTFISVPAFAYAGDLTFLQIAFGYIIGRGLVTVLLMPTLFQRGILSVYELVRRYFGTGLERTVSILFITTRTLSDGLRLLGASIVLSFLFSLSGTPTNSMLVVTICVLATVTVFYTWVGGMTAVVWVDVIQLGLYLVGALVAIGLLVTETPDGIRGALTLADDAGKLSVLDFGFDVSRDYTFWSAVIGGAVFTAGTHGADQMFVQRYLACASLSHARRALLVSGFVVLIQFSLFLLLGLLLWAYYEGITGVLSGFPSSADQVLAYFINTKFPIGLRGIMVAAVIAAAMSTLSSSLNSSAAALIGNFLKRSIKSVKAEERHLRVSRFAILFFGSIQVIVAVVGIAISERLIDDVLRVQFFSGGMMLGIFLLIAAGYRRPIVGAVGLVVGLSATVFLSVGTEVSWQWYACVGACSTFAAGVITDIVQNVWT